MPFDTQSKLVVEFINAVDLRVETTTGGRCTVLPVLVYIVHACSVIVQRRVADDDVIALQRGVGEILEGLACKRCYLVDVRRVGAHQVETTDRIGGSR